MKAALKVSGECQPPECHKGQQGLGMWTVKLVDETAKLDV